MNGRRKFLIVGQGLAGTTLALKLIERGHHVEVVDDGHLHSSTKVAAGICNPIVFRRINKTWRVDEFLPTANLFYRRMEEKLGKGFFFPMEILRRHASLQEQNLWFEKKDRSEFSAYLKNPARDFDPTPFISFPFGWGVVSGAAYLDTKSYLLAARGYLASKGAMLAPTELCDDTIESMALRQRVDAVVDCRGYRSASSTLWSYLPFGLTKGELLTLSCPQLDLRREFNAGFFLLPIGGDLFRLGATFDWQDMNQKPTDAGARELLQKFENMVNTSHTVVDHSAGIRPTVQDRRPLLGVHPENPDRYIFNGLGTKGVMMAPKLADLLLDRILDGEPLPGEMDVERFKDRFYGSERSVVFPG